MNRFRDFGGVGYMSDDVESVGLRSNDTASAIYADSAVSHIADDGRIEYVRDHLREVAEMAAGFAQGFGAGSWAYAAGLMHDIGKYSPDFQARILAGGYKCDHSTAGAYELAKQGLFWLAYCVAGHHGGLPDGGSSFDTSSEATLAGRMKRAAQAGIPDYSSFSSEISMPRVDVPVLDGSPMCDCYTLTMLARMVFSCLVDADFLCTERFMNGSSRQGLSSGSISELNDMLERKLASFFPPANDLNRARCGLLEDCMRAAALPRGVFSMTVPTGGGKTYASMRFALNHALAHPSDIRRVIYVIPYTSIIEQNADVFREVFGDENVLEHHMNFDFDDRGEQGERLRLASEDWDAPIVVTTNVQFFESLYSAKTSKCRKLHNITGSVVVLDEAQMLPTKYLEPCTRVLSELVDRYQCSVVLCSATQPTLGDMFEKNSLNVKEIASNPGELFGSLQRVRYHYDGILDDNVLPDAIAGHEQALCVVNSKAHARALYSQISEMEGSFHLSTSMTAVHRTRTLDAIRDRLREGLPCRVVSTSLVEAGVDLDFPVVFRELAGVDSIVQCAGRCNREGKRAAEDSVVHVFRSETDAYKVPREVAFRSAITQDLIAGCCEGRIDVDFDFGSLGFIEKYFTRLYAVTDDFDCGGSLVKMSKISNVKNPVNMGSVSFATVSEGFKLIDDETSAVVIPCADIESDVNSLKFGYASRALVRRMGRYSVSVYPGELKALRESGSVSEISDGLYVLDDTGVYSDETGLDASRAGGRGVSF